MIRAPYLLLAIVVIAGAALSCDDATSACEDPGGTGTHDTTGFQITLIESGLERPSWVTHAPGDFDRIFVLEQWTGRILILDLSDDSLIGTPFLDVDGLTTGHEQGLLGMAFHPDYAINGYLYVSYTSSTGDSIVERFRVSADEDVADPDSGQVVLSLDQPSSNHNGGWIAFGPNDGFLYVSTGDGGGANDSDSGSGHTAGIGNAQDIRDNLLGKILRLDVDGTDAYPGDETRNYAIPTTNPFIGTEGDDEIWAYGLRNPWRPSFDRRTGDLWIGDVGQVNWEEINFQPATSTGGENYGWRLREGMVATPTGRVGGDRPTGNVDPIFTYSHGGAVGYRGCSITGGYVYRGPLPALNGAYFFADFCRSEVASLRFDGSDAECFDGANYVDFRNHATDPPIAPGASQVENVSSFGEDAAGNLYMLDNGDGELFRIEALSP
jgi:glucose/arabinose dehydrogenase